MSLNWKLNAVKNHQTLCWDKDDNMNPVTYSLIFTTLSVGIGEITEKNVDEFLLRATILSIVRGAPMTKCVDDGNGGTRLESVDFTEKDIRDHIGLSTNVSTESRASFMKKMARSLVDKAKCRINSEVLRSKGS